MSPTIWSFLKAKPTWITTDVLGKKKKTFVLSDFVQMLAYIKHTLNCNLWLSVIFLNANYFIVSFSCFFKGSEKKFVYFCLFVLLGDFIVC